MTFYTVLNFMDEYNIDPESTYITISRQAANMKGTSAELKDGDILSVSQLFYGMMLPSGNDAAYALAEFFGELIKEKKFNFKHSNNIFGT